MIVVYYIFFSGDYMVKQHYKVIKLKNSMYNILDLFVKIIFWIVFSMDNNK
jgi:hypothetical protein